MSKKNKVPQIDFVTANNRMELLRRHDRMDGDTDRAALAVLRKERVKINKLANGSSDDISEARDFAFELMEIALVKRNVLVEPYLFDEDGRERWKDIEALDHEDRKASEAARTLINFMDTDIILDSSKVGEDEEEEVVLVAHNMPGSRVVEYMVSDGPPGFRSHSFDFFSLKAARKQFDKIVRNGWPKIKSR